MERLFLADLEGWTEENVLDHFVQEYEANEEAVKKFSVLIAYESVGSYGCDSSSWFLLFNQENMKLYEVHGSHCSCMGFEGQFDPSESSMDYLVSNNFSFCSGGYDGDSETNHKFVSDHLLKLSLFTDFNKLFDNVLELEVTLH